MALKVILKGLERLNPPKTKHEQIKEQETGTRKEQTSSRQLFLLSVGLKTPNPWESYCSSVLMPINGVNNSKIPHQVVPVVVSGNVWCFSIKKCKTFSLWIKTCHDIHKIMKHFSQFSFFSGLKCWKISSGFSTIFFELNLRSITSQ